MIVKQCALCMYPTKWYRKVYKNNWHYYHRECFEALIDPGNDKKNKAFGLLQKRIESKTVEE